MAVEVQGPVSDRRPLGDLIRNYYHESHCYVSATVKNPAGSAVTIDDPLGLPVKLVSTQWTFVAAADIANAGGVLVYDKPLAELAAAGITPMPLKILVRGPASVHEDGLSAVDHVGDDITAADFKSRLLTLGITTIEGPTVTSTQTT